MPGFALAGIPLIGKGLGWAAAHPIATSLGVGFTALDGPRMASAWYDVLSDRPERRERDLLDLEATSSPEIAMMARELDEANTLDVLVDSLGSGRGVGPYSSPGESARGQSALEEILGLRRGEIARASQRSAPTMAEFAAGLGVDVGMPA